MESLKEKVLGWWFVISTIALLIFYVLLDRRGRSLEQAKQDAQRALIQNKLFDISEKSSRSQEDYDKAKQDYLELLNRHGDLMRKLGLNPVVFPRRAAGPDNSRNPSDN